jgi:hypothetical protein
LLSALSNGSPRIAVDKWKRLTFFITTLYFYERGIIMKKFRFISLVLIPSLIFSNFIFATQISAQEPVAFGEIKAAGAAGAVQIESSTGQWVEMRDVYPLLKNTKLRTRDGIVSITTRGGSRIELSKDTEVAFEALNGGYTINLKQGTLSFNLTPPESLTVTAAQVTVSAVTNPENIRGMVICSEKGTEIRSISGKINVSYLGSNIKILAAGESLFVSAKGQVIAAAAGAATTGTTAGTTIGTTGLIVAGALVTTGIVVAVSALGGGGGVVSPSAPPH